MLNTTQGCSRIKCENGGEALRMGESRMLAIPGDVVFKLLCPPVGSSGKHAGLLLRAPLCGSSVCHRFPTGTRGPSSSGWYIKASCRREFTFSSVKKVPCCKTERSRGVHKEAGASSQDTLPSDELRALPLPVTILASTPSTFLPPPRRPHSQLSRPLSQPRFRAAQGDTQASPALQVPPSPACLPLPQPLFQKRVKSQEE